MNIQECSIKGIYIIEGLRFPDNRGELIKPFSSSFMPKGLNLEFKETWFTKSRKNVIRGMHLQVTPYACEKLVSTIAGRVVDVLLDLRDQSPTYGQTYSIELSGENIQSIYIPKGIAHGYKVIEDSIVMYMATEVNKNQYDIGIRWDSFGYNWEVTQPILSEKDINLPEFNKSESRY